MDDLKALLAAARDGDRHSLYVLLKRFEGRIRGAMAAAVPDSLRHVLDLSDDDLVHQLFIDLCRRLGRIDPDRANTVESWLGTIAHRVALDAVDALTTPGRNVFRVARAPDGAENDWLAHAARIRSADRPSQIVSRREMVDLVRQAVARLPARYRDAILRHDLDEWTVAETAAELGISEPAVKMRLVRAREMLAELIGLSQA